MGAPFGSDRTSGRTLSGKCPFDSTVGGPSPRGGGSHRGGRPLDRDLPGSAAGFDPCGPAWPCHQPLGAATGAAQGLQHPLHGFVLRRRSLVAAAEPATLCPRNFSLDPHPGLGRNGVGGHRELLSATGDLAQTAGLNRARAGIDADRPPPLAVVPSPVKYLIQGSGKPPHIVSIAPYIPRRPPSPGAAVPVRNIPRSLSQKIHSRFIKRSHSPATLPENKAVHKGA